jgi:hypothetical protein
VKVPKSHADVRFKTKLGDYVDGAFAGTGVPVLEDMADFVHGHGCEFPRLSAYQLD